MWHVYCLFEATQKGFLTQNVLGFLSEAHLYLSHLGTVIEDVNILDLP